MLPAPDEVEAELAALAAVAALKAQGNACALRLPQAVTRIQTATQPLCISTRYARPHCTCMTVVNWTAVTPCSIAETGGRAYALADCRSLLQS